MIQKHVATRNKVLIKMYISRELRLIKDELLQLCFACIKFGPFYRHFFCVGDVI